MYDFPAMIEYVCDATGYEKVKFTLHRFKPYRS